MFTYQEKVKYKDVVEQFPDSAYSVDVGLDSLLEHISRYMEDYGLEVNPDFQRGHVWSRQQQIDYMEFRFRGGRSGRDIYINCADWNSKKIETPMVIVDGLQRLSAAFAFLFGQIPLFGHYIYEYDRLRMSGMYNIFKFHIAELQTKEEVLEWYIALNAGGTPHSEEEINRIRKMLNG